MMFKDTEWKLTDVEMKRKTRIFDNSLTESSIQAGVLPNYGQDWFTNHERIY